MDLTGLEHNDIESIDDISDIQDIDDITDIEDIDDISDIEDIDDIVGDNRDNRVDNAVGPIGRYICDAQNPYELYDEYEFKSRYRFDKDTVLYGILPKIHDGLAKVNHHGLPIPPELQLLVCLRYYATASFQQPLGDMMQISQPTVSRIIFHVSCLLASLILDYIRAPRDPEACKENHQLFNDLGKRNGGIGLPGIDGAIDCTHVRLALSKFQNIDEIFRNQRGYFSLNVQAVVGPRMEFLDIVPEWPGSAHDSRIFQNSAIYMRYLERRSYGMLVGDKGYPCLPFLMTPIANPQTDEELTYNDIQSRTRLVIERTFGVWKRRFPCLSRGLSTKLVCCTTIVVACAVLHNMSLIFKDELPEFDEISENDEEVPLPLLINVRNADGFAAREALIARLFD